MDADGQSDDDIIAGENDNIWRGRGTWRPITNQGAREARNLPVVWLAKEASEGLEGLR